MNQFLTSLPVHGKPGWSNWYSDYLRDRESGLESCQDQGILTSSSANLQINRLGVKRPEREVENSPPSCVEATRNFYSNTKNQDWFMYRCVCVFM